MGFSVRSLGPSLALCALVLTPAFASAQGNGRASAPPAAAPPPPGGGAPAGGAPASGGGAGPAGADKPAAAEPPKSTGNVGGVSFNDKPAPRRNPVARGPARRSGPLETFPGFEQLADGGSRFFVQLNQNVPVEERKAQGSITYVLRGAHLRVNNDANALVTVHFNTPVFRARLTPQGNDLLFILELRSAATPTFKMVDNPDKTAKLQIDFAKGDFITGDGSGEVLPRETRPENPGGRRRGRGKPQQPATPAGGDDPNGPTP